MSPERIAACLFLASLFLIVVGRQPAGAQQVQVEAGGGWAVPSSSVEMSGTSVSNVDSLDGQQVPPLSVDMSSGGHAYVALGLQWRLSSNFDLGARLRVQHVNMGGDASDLTSRLIGCQEGTCRVSNQPDGYVRTATFEGRIVLTSVGRFEPYFLVGLGIVYTSVDGVDTVIPPGSQDDRELSVNFDDVSVTDAGGDVGFGTYFELVGDLDLVGELRATGSLPGAKENAVTTFPFTLGLSYAF